MAAKEYGRGDRITFMRPGEAIEHLRSCLMSDPQPVKVPKIPLIDGTPVEHWDCADCRQAQRVLDRLLSLGKKLVDAGTWGNPSGGWEIGTPSQEAIYDLGQLFLGKLYPSDAPNAKTRTTLNTD